MVVYYNEHGLFYFIMFCTTQFSAYYCIIWNSSEYDTDLPAASDLGL